jgi:hypothetical protein
MSNPGFLNRAPQEGHFLERSSLMNSTLAPHDGHATS